MLRPGEVIIHDGNFRQFLSPPTGQGFGLVPRNFSVNPCGSFPYAPRFALPKVPRSEWPRMVKEMIDAKSLLSDLRNIGYGGQPIPSRDQNGRGYCWAHSTVSCAILRRCASNQPYEDLSAYMIACIIKNYRDEGGYGAESMDFLAKVGCATSKKWPQQGVSRSYDTPDMRAEAALYKQTEQLDIPEGDFEAQFTLLLDHNPHTLDLNWWSHSIAAADPVEGTSMFGLMRNECSGKLVDMAEFNAIWQPDKYGGAFGIRIWNSWGDSWSANGMGILTESKATNNGAVALMNMRFSP